MASSISTRRAMNFNPRTPHGVRLAKARFPGPLLYFNPRTPHGVRRLSDAELTNFRRFQSTHPSRGATSPRIFSGADSSDFNPRTPHGVRRHSVDMYEIHKPFQSTHPSRGATREMGPLHRSLDISIHAPLTGCDCRWMLGYIRTLSISIHAPLTGCDRIPNWYNNSHVYFNPRTPHGVRP